MFYVYSTKTMNISFERFGKIVPRNFAEGSSICFNFMLTKIYVKPFKLTKKKHFSKEWYLNFSGSLENEN